MEKASGELRSIGSIGHVTEIDHYSGAGPDWARKGGLAKEPVGQHARCSGRVRRPARSL